MAVRKLSDKTTALTRFKELYRRMEAAGASDQELLAVARDLAAAERARDRARRCRPSKGKPLAKAESPAKPSLLRQLANRQA